MQHPVGGNSSLLSCLAYWIWKPLIEAELNEYVEQANDHRVRKQNEKRGPSGVSATIAFDHPEQLGGVDCLVAVDSAYIDSLLANHKGAEMIKFWSDGFDLVAHEVFGQIGSPSIQFRNAWHVWASMCPLLIRALQAENLIM